MLRINKKHKSKGCTEEVKYVREREMFYQLCIRRRDSNLIAQDQNKKRQNNNFQGVKSENSKRKADCKNRKTGLLELKDKRRKKSKGLCEDTGLLKWW